MGTCCESPSLRTSSSKLTRTRNAVQRGSRCRSCRWITSRRVAQRHESRWLPHRQGHYVEPPRQGRRRRFHFQVVGVTVISLGSSNVFAVYTYLLSRSAKAMLPREGVKTGNGELQCEMRKRPNTTRKLSLSHIQSPSTTPCSKNPRPAPLQTNIDSPSSTSMPGSPTSRSICSRIILVEGKRGEQHCSGSKSEARRT